MESDKPSLTAYGAASLRCFHQLFDGQPKILDDQITPILLKGDVLNRISVAPEKFEEPASRRLRSHILLRSRYSEDCLKEAVESGIKQIIILGAGLDTYAYRQPPATADVSVFEVDHPSTQRSKLALLKKTGIDVPLNLSFVPIDFEKQRLQDVLIDHGFDAELPSFVSWLGVTVYLTEEAIDEVLRFVSALAKGSQLVFSFAEPIDDRAQESRDTMMQRARAVGEHWVSFFTPEEMEQKLNDAGFTAIKVPSPEYLLNLFDGRIDGLVQPRRVGLMQAIV